MGEKPDFRIELKEWLWDNLPWQLDPPQEFVDNWTRIFAKRSEEAIEPAWQDLWFLHNWVKEKKPQTILEFGSGCSTVVMAHALWHNRRGWIDSVEDRLEWLSETQKITPSYLSAISTIYHCNVSLEEYEGQSVLRYWPSFPTKPDFIFLDGPVSFEKASVTINPLELEPSFPKGFTMIVDARAPTVSFYIKYFKRHYRWTRIRGIDNGLSIFELLE